MTERGSIERQPAKNSDAEIKEHISRYALVLQVSDGEHYPNYKPPEEVTSEQISISALSERLEHIPEGVRYVLVDSAQHIKPGSEYDESALNELMHVYESYVDGERADFEVFFTSVPMNLALRISKDSLSREIYQNEAEILNQLLPERLENAPLD